MKNQKEAVLKEANKNLKTRSMTSKTKKDRRLKDLIQRLDENYKKKMKNFKTMTGSLGRGIGHP